VVFVVCVSGIVVTPLLILWALGSAASVQYVTVVRQLVVKVLVPVAIGQGLRAGSRGLRARVDSAKAKLRLKLTTESVLVLIIYTTFCQAFVSGLGLSGRDLWLLLAIVPSLHLCLLALSWAIIRSLGVPRDQQVGPSSCPSVC
jgi:sodium/bile acid cotransporter 7